jgi:antitoxin (DNA-binding transcriptional repressor) of toxin-antitoxin stability system
MKTISVGELRQNPTAALDAVEHGETFVVTRHRREIAVLSPVHRRNAATPADYLAMIAATPVDASWAEEVRADREEFGGDRDPWVA